MSHQDRRDPLPKGYQFGDAGPQSLVFHAQSYAAAICGCGWSFTGLVETSVGIPSHDCPLKQLLREN